MGETCALESDTADSKPWSCMSRVILSQLLNLSEPQFLRMVPRDDVKAWRSHACEWNSLLLLAAGGRSACSLETCSSLSAFADISICPFSLQHFGGELPIGGEQ